MVEISPRPSDIERRAILAALERLLAQEHDRATGAWWAAGLPAVDEDER